jgi:hypothetical protein
LAKAQMNERVSDTIGANDSLAKSLPSIGVTAQHEEGIGRARQERSRRLPPDFLFHTS